MVGMDTVGWRAIYCNILYYKMTISSIFYVYFSFKNQSISGAIFTCMDWHDVYILLLWPQSYLVPTSMPLGGVPGLMLGSSHKFCSQYILCGSWQSLHLVFAELGVTMAQQVELLPHSSSVPRWNLDLGFRQCGVCPFFLRPCVFLCVCPHLNDVLVDS